VGLRDAETAFQTFETPFCFFETPPLSAETGPLQRFCQNIFEFLSYLNL
jgi:hypothetical protein